MPDDVPPPELPADQARGLIRPPNRTLSAGRSTVQVYCSPRATPDLDPQPALLYLIGSAKQSILVGLYSFTSMPIAQALIAKHQAGVPVRIAADAGEYTATSQYPAMLAAGLDIHVGVAATTFST